ncbi:MAG: low affinity iron permease family protein [Ilumatobacteraceae bacterium]
MASQRADAARSSTVLHHVGETVANAFAGLTAAVLATVWLIVGLVTGFPTWWQVALYSSTATVTFVMVFVIQHTQSKQIVALQRKLDELIRASHHADNALISVEDAPPTELQQLGDAYRTLATTPSRTDLTDGPSPPRKGS